MPAWSTASQIEPSAISESPQSTQTREGIFTSLRGERDADADRQALAERAGGDVDPGRIGVGWPSSREPSLRKVRSSSSVIAPTAFSIE